MPWPNETMPVKPTSRLSEVANRPNAEQRITKSSSALLSVSIGSIASTAKAASAISTSK